MNEKEVGEIRRRFKGDKSNITKICGCYVNEKNEIVAEIRESIGAMSESEADELLAILKRTLTGTIGKNLIDMTFSTAQMMDGEEYKLLSHLRDTGLNDEESISGFLTKIVETQKMDSEYMVILAYESYDVPNIAKDLEEIDSDNVFSYFLCSICPIKYTKPSLGFKPFENKFSNISVSSVISPPQLGFMFPAYEDKGANISKALMYTRDVADSHEEFVEAIFNCNTPMPAAVQKETFQSILNETIAEDCNYEVAQTVHEQISDMIEEHKEKKEVEPLVISKNTVKNVLKVSGVSDEHIEAFEEKYDTEFGENVDISPKNIIDSNKFQLKTPDVVINVSPDRSELIKTQVINGVKYILIPANEGVEVNGININIS